jgi:hypothetical protein
MADGQLATIARSPVLSPSFLCRLGKNAGFSPRRRVSAEDDKLFAPSAFGNAKKRAPRAALAQPASTLALANLERRPLTLVSGTRSSFELSKSTSSTPALVNR